jgi:DNA-binding response OmpR family regulator
MTSRPARLLCVGEDLKLLQTRCAVLERSGYHAQSAVLPEAEDLLRSQEFDLLIVSAWLPEWEKAKILTTAGKTPTLMLTELTLADKLLADVERLLEA